MFRAREDIYELLEACCGARLTVSYVRIGGLAQDVPEDFEARCRKALASVRDVLETRATTCSPATSIFQKRFKDVGVMDKDDALSWGWVGPCLRGSGVAYDVRKDHPYSGYEQYDFDVPVGTVGDCYDRYLVRMEEMRRACASSSRPWRSCPRAPSSPTTARSRCPPSPRCTRTSSPS